MNKRIVRWALIALLGFTLACSGGDGDDKTKTDVTGTDVIETTQDTVTNQETAGEDLTTQDVAAESVETAAPDVMQETALESIEETLEETAAETEQPEVEETIMPEVEETIEPEAHQEILEETTKPELIEPETTEPDADGDGVADADDNCPAVANPDQEDLDQDGLGDVCDADIDGDGAANGDDCEPADPAIHPGAGEVCDGVDNNCDGDIDTDTCYDGDPCTDDVCDGAAKKCVNTDNGTCEGLDWIGDLSIYQNDFNDLTLDPAVDKAYRFHDLIFTVDTFPMLEGQQLAAADVMLVWISDADDDDTVNETAMFKSADNVGPYGNNQRWEVTLPYADFSDGGELTFWVEAMVGGKLSVDDNGGEKYSLTLQDPPTPTWWERGVYSFTKCKYDPDTGGCDSGWFWNAGLNPVLDLDPSDYQTYGWAPRLAIEFYIPGVTDSPDYQAMIDSGFLQVEVFSPIFSGSPEGEWIPYSIKFEEKYFDNLRYSWFFYNFYGPGEIMGATECVQDGTYPWKFRVSTSNGEVWSYIGDGTPPESGDDMQLTWTDYTYPPGLTTMGEKTLGAAVGGSTSSEFTFVNTGNDTVVVTKVEVVPSATDDISFAVLEGPQFGDVPFELLSGDKYKLNVTYSPQQAGPSTATLKLHVYSTQQPCKLKGVIEHEFTGGQ